MADEDILSLIRNLETNLSGSVQNLQTNLSGSEQNIIRTTDNLSNTLNALITKDAFFNTVGSSTGDIFTKFLNDTKELYSPNILNPTGITENQPREFRRVQQGTQIIQLSLPIYLWGNGLSTHGGILQDFFPFSSRTPEEENEYLWNLWELPTSTPQSFKSGPALDLLQEDIDKSLGGNVLVFPLIRNSGSIMGQYDFEITSLDSFRNKKVRMLPNSVLNSALTNAGINYQSKLIGGSALRAALETGEINGGEFNSIEINNEIGLLDQTRAKYCNTSIVQEYLSVFVLLVNKTFFDSLNNEQVETFHTVRRNISSQTYESNKETIESLYKKLRAGGFDGIEESTLSPTAVSELSDLVTEYINDSVDRLSENFDPILAKVYDIYNNS